MNTARPAETPGFTAADAARRIQQREEKKMANINVKVSIQVVVGGFTGQRDSWENYPHDRQVKLTEEGLVELTDSKQNKFSFNPEDLEAALAFLKRGAAPATPPIAYRGGSGMGTFDRT